jgi:predicted phage-related endonuclease
MDVSCKPIAGPAALSPEWHAMRRFDPVREVKVVFGATDAAACCGISPYRTPLDVFVEKRHNVAVEENEAMRMGRRLEPIILDEYEARRRPCVLERGLPMYFHGQYRWMGATPDALARERRGSDQGPWGVDAKASTFRRLDKEGEDPLKFGVEGTDQMPVDYVLQGQQQCAVLNLPFVEFPVLFDARTLRIYRVERNEDLIAAIVKAEQEMYERLVNNDPPEPNWAHDNTKELIGVLFGHREDLVQQLNEEDRDLWGEICEWKLQIKDLEERVKIETNKLLYRFGGAARGVFPAGQKQLKRIVIKDSLVTEKDVADLAAKVGQVKRRGCEYLRETNVTEK